MGAGEVVEALVLAAADPGLERSVLQLADERRADRRGGERERERLERSHLADGGHLTPRSWRSGPSRGQRRGRRERARARPSSSRARPARARTRGSRTSPAPRSLSAGGSGGWTPLPAAGARRRGLSAREPGVTFALASAARYAARAPWNRSRTTPRSAAATAAGSTRRAAARTACSNPAENATSRSPVTRVIAARSVAFSFVFPSRQIVPGRQGRADVERLVELRAGECRRVAEGVVARPEIGARDDRLVRVVARTG